MGAELTRKTKNYGIQTLIIDTANEDFIIVLFLR
jgi:hypothetical protein